MTRCVYDIRDTDSKFDQTLKAKVVTWPDSGGYWLFSSQSLKVKEWEIWHIVQVAQVTRLEDVHDILDNIYELLINV